MHNRLNWVAVLCALTIPALRILNRDGVDPNSTLGQQVTTWLVLTSFLLLVWYTNARLYAWFGQQKRVPDFTTLAIVLLADCLIILLEMSLMLFGWIPLSFVENSTLHYVLFLRLSIGTGLIAVIQYAFLVTLRQGILNRQNEQLRSERLMAELEGLKQQVNPHFLFNSLGTLRAMIREKDENAEQFVLSLSAVYRRFLTKRTELTAPLTDELDLLENYLFMLRFRFEEGLDVTIDIDQTNQLAQLPIFCLQQLTANCIKHNIVSVSKPLSIRVYQQTPASITVENNKQLKTSGVDSTGTGLANLRKRCNLLGLKNGVTVVDTPDLFSVTVTLLDP